MKKYWKEILIGFLTGVLNGVFGAGGGCVLVPASEKFLKLDEKKSHATAIAVVLLMSAVSSAEYIRRGFFDFRLWLWASVGGTLGGVMGARILGKISKKYLKLGFGAVICVTALKMIF